MIKNRLPYSPLGSAGYSVVEMAIVLAVLGLLLGSVLLPLSARFKGEQLQSTRELLERVETAVFSYAMRNSTKPAQAVLTGGEKAAQIPGGRPYLPCPDISGDGYEDRYSPLIGSGGTDSVPETSVTLTLVLDASDETLLERPMPTSLAYTVTLDADRTDNKLVSQDNSSRLPGLGACSSDKGWVPWATLGLPPADVWGNRITYRVDPFFANSVLGFGYETRSDPFDPRMPLTATVSAGQDLTVYQRRQLGTYVDSSHTQASNTLALYIDEGPGVVCNAYTTTAGCSPFYDSANNLTIELLNEATATDLTLFDVYAHITIARLYQPEDIVNGMAFVLVSHGSNGFGAVAHDTTQGYLPYCRDITTNLNEPETDNADFRNLCSLDRSLPGSTTNTRDTPSAAAHSFARNHSFVILPNHRIGQNGFDFDDELRFMTGTELISKLADLGRKFGGYWVPPGPT